MQNCRWCRYCVDFLINIVCQPAPIINTSETDDEDVFKEEDDQDDGDDFADVNNDDKDFDVDDGNDDDNEYIDVDDVNDDDDEDINVVFGIDNDDEDFDVEQANDDTDHQDRIHRVFVDLLPNLSGTKTLESLVILIASMICISSIGL